MPMQSAAARRQENAPDGDTQHRSSAEAVAAADAARAMDRMYRLTRHVYDASRKYYLLGRDRTIAQLGLGANDRLLEVGCGTARNLIATARRYPSARLFGVDISEEMLKTASRNLARANLPGEIHVAQGDATSFAPESLFGEPAGFDRVLFSYSLSIMPPWQAAIDHAVRLARPGGELHVVDFGDSAGMPRWFRGVLFGFLEKFGVHWKPEIPAYFRQLEQQGLGRVAMTPMRRGYCYRLVFTKLGG